MGVCNCSIFCCMLLYVHSGFAIILVGKNELVALLSLSSWSLVIVVWPFLAVDIDIKILLCVEYCGAVGLSAVCDYGIS